MRRVLCLAAFLLASCQTTGGGSAGPVSLSAAGAYTQARTGMVFPPSVGDFERVEIVRYREDGSDESGGYNRDRPPGGEIIATVYVYPSPRLLGALGSQSANRQARTTLCRSELEQTKQVIEGAHPGARLSSDGEVALSQGDAAYTGLAATFGYGSGETGFFDQRDVELRSHLHLYCYVGGQWNVKYRFTHRADYDAEKAIAAFMRDLTITIPGGQGEQLLAALTAD